MNKFLITGRAGSGKSTINKELVRRGYGSIDADSYTGLARWEDVKTGQPVVVDSSEYVDYSEVGWNWQADIIKEILDDPNVRFVCGSASNQLEFHRLFDTVFVLTLDPATQLHRLQTRESPYGKDPRQQRETIEDQAIFVRQATELGAIAVDVTRPLEDVVDDILAHTRTLGDNSNG